MKNGIEEYEREGKEVKGAWMPGGRQGNRGRVKRTCFELKFILRTTLLNDVG